LQPFLRHRSVCIGKRLWHSVRGGKSNFCLRYKENQACCSYSILPLEANSLNFEMNSSNFGVDPLPTWAAGKSCPRILREEVTRPQCTFSLHICTNPLLPKLRRFLPLPTTTRIFKPQYLANNASRLRNRTHSTFWLRCYRFIIAALFRSALIDRLIPLP